jgi:pimeloyl-ACP methyl ester carboxylesterase
VSRAVSCSAPATVSFRADSLRLVDGRRLSYSETGSERGIAVIYCHGAIGTPLERSVDIEMISETLGVRYVAISRPGFGRSDPVPGRSVVDFAADVAELADALEIGRFAVAGVSAGGPYALGLACALPDRVTRVAVCSSLSPLCPPHRTPGMCWRTRLGLALLAGAPGPCAAAGDAAVRVIRRHPELLSRVIAAHAAPSERELVLAAGERAAASASFLEAAAGGVRGMIDDYLSCARPWGFSVSDVQAEVHLWHGLRDPLVPIEHALQLAVQLPRCRPFLDPDEGHHFFRRRLSEILAALIGQGDGPTAPLAATHKRALDGRRRARPRR